MPDTPLPPPSGGLRFGLRALAAFRFLPPLSWIFGGSSLYRHAGLTYRLYPARNHQDRALWICEAFDERKSMDALAAEVRGRRALIFDIGANVGIFTTFLARAAGAGSRVVAFEPNPVVFRRLSENVALNDLGDRVELRQHALGDRSGEVTLHVPMTNFGGASLRPKTGPGGAHKVEVQTLAPFLDGARGYDRVVLKIDVEGLEDRILLPIFDAADPADWPDVILLEVSSQGDWESDLLGQLVERGYRRTLSPERNGIYVRDRTAPAAHASPADQIPPEQLK